MLKREYFEEDITCKIIKKEEECYFKTEETSSIETSCFQDRLTDPLALPWTFDNPQFYIQPKIATDWTSLIPPRLMTSDEASQEESEETIKHENMVKLEPNSNNQRHFFDKNISTKISKATKKAKKPSACKNYLVLVCSGFSRTILTARSNSHILQHMNELISVKKNKHAETKPLSQKNLFKSIKNHISEAVCGKKLKEDRKNRDFKIRTKTELSQLLMIKTEDCVLTCLKKEILQEMIDYFFISNAYIEWLSNGMMTPKNRGFLLANRIEIHQKFRRPITYKPRFIYDVAEML